LAYRQVRPVQGEFYEGSKTHRQLAVSASFAGRFILMMGFLSAFGAAMAQEPVATLPKNYQLIFDNPALAVLHAHYEPHEKVPLHDHSKFPTVYVYLSDSGPVLFSHVEEHPFSLLRPPVKMGAYRVSPGRIERHAVENKGDIPSDFLRVELNQVTIRHFSDEFRGPARADLSHDADKIEFRNGDVEVERIICVIDSSCEIKATPAPSVVIAFTPVQLIGDRSKATADHVEAGSVRWMDTGEALAIRADSKASAHVLRILLPSSSLTKTPETNRP
jgi:hypothetical protein